jgi:predicted DNA binding CopG/RHH family protein
MTKINRKTKQIRIPEKQWRWIKLEAIKKGITMSKLLEEIIKLSNK